MAVPLQAAQQAAQLLDFSQKFDVNLLDAVVQCGLGGAVEGQTQSTCQQVLAQLKAHPDAWTRVDMILEFSPSQTTKFYALGILEDVIKSKWKALAQDHREGIKKYIVGLIIKLSSDATTLVQEQLFISKLNSSLVQILKHEWPLNWPTFISDIVGASKTNESLCQNNMVILKILSEEIFQFSDGQMTQQKAKHLREKMCSEFSEVFNLCTYVMDTSTAAPLVDSTLKTLHGFLHWIPYGFIFQTKLISTLIYKFLNVPMFRNVTLNCLTEIASIQAPQYDEQHLILFQLTMNQLKQMLPLTTYIKDAYKEGRDQEQAFVLQLSLFLSTFLKEHSALLEGKPDMHSYILEALHYLVLISEVEEKEIFKICLEYWNALAANLYSDNPYGASASVSTGPLGSSTGLTQAESLKRELYLPVLSKVRLVMISRMAKPEEVVVVENEAGEVVREQMKDTDAINLYKTMRETLVYLTHLDYNDTERIMTEKLTNQVNGSEWSWKNLNTLCWAIGSISGAMHEEDEKRFLVMVIRDLLGMCELKRGKDNKAIIASNIMYIVGQYPRFLRAHWKFLKTVVKKLFEFMHETHDGVQDMACDTFIKIAQKCRRHFVLVQPGEVMPYIEEILNTIQTIICDLQPLQVHTFYEAVGYMISAQTDSMVMERLIEKYFLLPNNIWDSIIAQATKDVNVLQVQETVRQLGNILKTNVRGCIAIGHPYVTQLGRIYLDMLNVYKVLSENISAQYRGDTARLPAVLVQAMQSVKQDTLRVISTWVSKSRDPNMVLENFIPPLLDAVLGDYQRNNPSAREPLVLSTMATIVNKLEGHITPHIPVIFDAVFECTLEMINKDFLEFPEHRTNFFDLIQAVTSHCFAAFLQIPAQQFKLVIDSIIWAFKHPMRNVADTGLTILFTMLKNVEQTPAVQSFYQTYYLLILQHIFAVVTDSSHMAGLPMHASILAHLFRIVENRSITACLFDTAPATENSASVAEFVARLLKDAFPHLQDAQVQVLVQGFFTLDEDVSAFKEHLRDFLVQIKQVAGENSADLFLVEREAELKQVAEEKRRRQLSVPGIINPHELHGDEME